MFLCSDAEMREVHKPVFLIFRPFHWVSDEKGRQKRKEKRGIRAFLRWTHADGVRGPHHPYGWLDAIGVVALRRHHEFIR